MQHYGTAVRKYQSVGVHGGVADADPHRLIGMLFDGALDRIAQAKGCMQRSEVARKAEMLSAAVAIVDGLRVSLDLEKGGQLAANLADIYEYSGRRLAEANLKNEPAYLDEVTGLLREIRNAWFEIGPGGTGTAAE